MREEERPKKAPPKRETKKKKKKSDNNNNEFAEEIFFALFLFTMTKPLASFVRKPSASDEIHFTAKQRVNRQNSFSPAQRSAVKKKPTTTAAAVAGAATSTTVSGIDAKLLTELLTKVRI